MRDCWRAPPAAVASFRETALLLAAVFPFCGRGPMYWLGLGDDGPTLETTLGEQGLEAVANLRHHASPSASGLPSFGWPRNSAGRRNTPRLLPTLAEDGSAPVGASRIPGCLPGRGLGLALPRRWSTFVTGPRVSWWTWRSGFSSTGTPRPSMNWNRSWPLSSQPTRTRFSVCSGRPRRKRSNPGPLSEGTDAKQHFDRGREWPNQEKPAPDSNLASSSPRPDAAWRPSQPGSPGADPNRSGSFRRPSQPRSESACASWWNHFRRSESVCASWWNHFRRSESVCASWWNHFRRSESVCASWWNHFRRSESVCTSWWNHFRRSESVCASWWNHFRRSESVCASWWNHFRRSESVCASWWNHFRRSESVCASWWNHFRRSESVCASWWNHFRRSESVCASWWNHFRRSESVCASWRTGRRHVGRRPG